MASVRLARAAEQDLLEIGFYSLEKWGEAQSLQYVDSLEACFQTLAAIPHLGRTCTNLRRGLRRIEHGRHVVFYRTRPDGILVSRILHERMLPDTSTFPSA
jgi:toxin ParE1/3/4